jgi:hypothetical protein
MKAACSDDEFVRLWNEHQSPLAVAHALKVNVRNVYARRSAIEARRGIEMRSMTTKARATFPENGIRTLVEIENGIVLISSDHHYWPGIVSTAHRAFVVAARELKPKAVILNGDVSDGARSGRHPRIGWQSSPSIKQELEAAQERTGEIEEEAKDALTLWNMGNHDIRFDSKLSAMVPEFEGVQGFALKDHFPRWRIGMSTLINGHTMVKHRWHNGIHATYNNVLKSGLSIVTGHLHALGVRAYTDYRGTRYAIDTGTLAAPDGPQFTYAEDNPQNHRSGFAVLTFHNGKLMPPELVEVIDEDAGLIFFRGQVVQV